MENRANLSQANVSDLVLVGPATMGPSPGRHEKTRRTKHGWWDIYIRYINKYININNIYIYDEYMGLGFKETLETSVLFVCRCFTYLGPTLGMLQSLLNYESDKP